MGDLIFLRTFEPSKERVINLGAILCDTVFFLHFLCTALPHRSVKKCFCLCVKYRLATKGSVSIIPQIFMNFESPSWEMSCFLILSIFWGFFFLDYFSFLGYGNGYSFLYFHLWCKLAFTHFCKHHFSVHYWDWLIFRKRIACKCCNSCIHNYCIFTIKATKVKDHLHSSWRPMASAQFWDGAYQPL